MVVCIACGIDKEKTEFYKHKQTIDGILHKCKDCVKEYTRSKDRKEYDKIREQTPKRKAWKKQRLKKFREENPDKRYAQKKVNNFIRFHKELKPDYCFVSGEKSKMIHLHHFDYTKPNEVIPCTPKIHSDFHRGIIKEIKQEWILKLPF